MSQVTVNLYATLRRHVGGAASVEVEIEPQQTVEQVLDHLGVPAHQTRVLFVDNQASELSRQLTGSEKLDVFPAIGGG